MIGYIEFGQFASVPDAKQMTKVTIQVNLEFEMFSERFAFGNVYNFVRDSLFENIHRKVGSLGVA